ncbi:hypothetical protein [Coleofasciculus sp. F4-SAH-05]
MSLVICHLSFVILASLRGGCGVWGVGVWGVGEETSPYTLREAHVTDV